MVLIIVMRKDGIFFFFTINILKIIWRIDKAFSFIFYLFRQFCLELNGLAVKLQVIFSLT